MFCPPPRANLSIDEFQKSFIKLYEALILRSLSIDDKTSGSSVDDLATRDHLGSETMNHLQANGYICKNVQTDKWKITEDGEAYYFLLLLP